LRCRDAVIIEDPIHAMREAAFAAPVARWCPKGGLQVLCAILMPPGTARALSRVLRTPDFAIRLPGLITWQAMDRWHCFGAQPSTQRPFVIGGM